jgi:hypothetical protein
MQVPLYQQRVGVPRLREQVNPEAAELGAIARFGEGVTAISADVAARIAGAIKSKEINKALTDAKESWYDFARELEQDNDYLGYEKKFNDYKQKLQADLTGEMKLPGSRRTFNERFESWAVDRQEDIAQLARQKFLADARSNLYRDVNQDIRDLDEAAFDLRITEAIEDGIIDPEDGEKTRLAGSVQIRTGKVKTHVRKYGYEEGIAELNKNRKYYRDTWDITDDEVDEIINDLKREWGTQLELKAKEYERIHKIARLRIADGIETDTEQPLTQDELLQMFKEDRIDWTEYLRFKGYLDDMAAAKIKAAEDKAKGKEEKEDKKLDAWKETDQELKGEILDIIFNDDIPQADRREEADRLLDELHGPDEEGNPQIGNTDYKVLKKLSETYNPSRGFVEGKKHIENLYKTLIEDREGKKTALEDTKQLTKEKVDRILEFEEEIRLGPEKKGREYTEDEKIEIAGNIVNKDRARALDLIENRVFAKGLAGRYFADEIVRDMGAKNQLLGMEEEILLPFSEKVIEAYRIRFDKLPVNVLLSVPDGEVYALDEAGKYYTLYNGKLRIWDDDKEKWVHFKETK